MCVEHPVGVVDTAERVPFPQAQRVGKGFDCGVEVACDAGGAGVVDASHESGGVEFVVLDLDDVAGPFGADERVASDDGGGWCERFAEVGDVEPPWECWRLGGLVSHRRVTVVGTMVAD